jgi:hypothetical protein
VLPEATDLPVGASKRGVRGCKRHVVSAVKRWGGRAPSGQRIPGHGRVVRVATAHGIEPMGEM